MTHWQVFNSWSNRALSCFISGMRWLHRLQRWSPIWLLHPQRSQWLLRRGCGSLQQLHWTRFEPLRRPEDLHPGWFMVQWSSGLLRRLRWTCGELRELPERYTLQMCLSRPGQVGPKHISTSVIFCPRCNPDWQLCNGAANCDDWSDEDPTLCNDCKMQGNVSKCEDSLFCVMDSWLCNGFPHCLDMSDELSPHFCNSTCEADDIFWCKDGTTCVPASFTCNGLDECPDESDETQELCQASAHAGTFRCNISQKLPQLNRGSVIVPF